MAQHRTWQREREDFQAPRFSERKVVLNMRHPSGRLFLTFSEHTLVESKHLSLQQLESLPCALAFPLLQPDCTHTYTNPCGPPAAAPAHWVSERSQMTLAVTFCDVIDHLSAVVPRAEGWDTFHIFTTMVASYSES